MTEETRYDVFLSHNSQDKPAVERLARRLTDEAGLRPFLDKWHLVPGEPWQEAIEEALDQSRTCAVFIGPRGIGPWENEEMRAAIDRRVSESKGRFRVIPVLLPGAERGKRGRLPAFLTRTTWVEFRESLDDPDAFHRLVAGIRGIAPGHGPGEVVYKGVCPYRGLQVFEEEHAPFFFGREAATGWLVNDLRSSHFLAVVGPSGSGKSSLVRAGLVPALRRGDLPGSETWPLCVFRPGHRPLESLAVALIQLVGPSDDLTASLRLMDALAADQRQLHLSTRLALTDAPAERTIALVVDQFEEMFTLCRDEGQRGSFIDNLLYASAIEGGRTVVVLTLRADFYGKCAAYPDLAARITDHQMLVGPMVEEELRQAIERPAHLVGLEFEGGLVEALLRDVQAEPGALPLLQHTLLELWERREGHRLTFAAYREIGGIQGAIAHRAESIYSGFDATQQAIARRVMLRLTQPGEGTEDTRRRAQKSELLPTGAQAEATEAVIQTLADARLVTTARDMATGEEQVDVAHEALIRGWPRLRGWIDEDRAGLRIHRRLTETAVEWEQHSRDESYLHRGARLAETEEWAEAHTDDMNPLEHEFLEASVALRDREAQEAERRRQRELEQARRLAEERRKRVLWLSGALILAIIAAIAAVWFGGQATRNAITARRERDAAERQSNINYARELKARALVQMAANAECALALATEAYDQASAISGFACYEFEDVVREALMQTNVWATLTGHTDQVTSVVWSPDGQRLASASNDSTVQLWDANTGENIATLTGHSELIWSVAWSPDGQRLASASGDSTIRLWDANTGENIATLTGHSAGVQSVVWSPDGQRLASASGDSTIRLWDANTGENIATLTGHTAGVQSVIWSPDGQRLASASDDYTIRLWNVESQESTVLSSPVQMTSLVWSPDGQRLASASGDGVIRLWSADTGENVATLTGHTAPIWSIAWSPYEALLASAANDSTIRLWDIGTGENTAILTGHSAPVRSVVWSPDAQRLASGSDDCTVRVWEVDTKDSVIIWNPTPLDSSAFILDVTWSPDGRQLAIASASEQTGHNIQLWNVDTKEKIAELTGHTNSILSLAWSPNGQRLASGSADGTIRLWNVDTRENIATLRGAGIVSNVAWSPDGQWLASASNESTAIQLWDANTGENITTLTGHTASIWSVAWSPDGRWLASGSLDYTIRLWDTDTWENTATLVGHTGQIGSVAWSPNGQQLASSAADTTIRLWNVDTGENIATLTSHTAVVWDIMWSPDGKQLASASNDSTIRLWDANTWENTATLTGHTSMVRAVTWSPDGRRLASAGMLDHTIIIYYADFQRDVLPIARAQLERGITPEERTLCLGEP